MRAPDSAGDCLLAIIGFNKDAYTLYPGADSAVALAFGLIASTANVLTKGQVLTDHLWMQQIWAWTQCIAIDPA